MNQLHNIFFCHKVFGRSTEIEQNLLQERQEATRGRYAMRYKERPRLGIHDVLGTPIPWFLEPLRDTIEFTDIPVNGLMAMCYMEVKGLLVHEDA